jgi:hypothetical protein
MRGRCIQASFVMVDRAARHFVRPPRTTESSPSRAVPHDGGGRVSALRGATGASLGRDVGRDHRRVS